MFLPEHQGSALVWLLNPTNPPKIPNLLKRRAMVRNKDVCSKLPIPWEIGSLKLELIKTDFC